MDPPTHAPHHSHYTLTHHTITGLPVNIHGLPELSTSATKVHILVLLHPLYRKQAFFNGLAKRTLGEFYDHQSASNTEGLIVVTTDQRNHGERKVREGTSNYNWSKANKTYAMDLISSYTGTALDAKNVVEWLPSYFPRHLTDVKTGESKVGKVIVSGVSLGAHATWISLLEEGFCDAGCVIVGCADYKKLMEFRAKNMNVESYLKDPENFWGGSQEVPKSLVEKIKKIDPAARWAVEKDVIVKELKGKKILALEGAVDLDVPPSFSEEIYGSMLSSGVQLEVRRWDDVAHICTDEMAGVFCEWVRNVISGEDFVSGGPVLEALHGSGSLKSKSSL